MTQQVQFRDCVFDPDQLEVRRGGHAFALTPQVFAVLEYLIAERDHVVLKDDLISAVWGDRIVTEATLSTAIKEVRRVVGDTGRAQHTIRTVHKRGFQFVAELVESKSGSEGKTPTLVVLPFRSLSASPDDKYIADGLSEDIITNLTRFRDIKVLSHLTAIHLQSSNSGPTDMTRTYGVDFVVEGSVRRSAERLRVTVQASDARTGELVLTEQFDRRCTTDALFEIQDEIALLTAGRVTSRHGDSGMRLHRRTSDGQTATWDVYTAVARFYEFYKTYDPTLHADLRNDLPTLLETDSSSSDGWAAYALLLLEERRYHLNERPDVNSTKLGLEAAKRAVACDRQSGFAHMALALCQFHTGDPHGFRASSKTALDLNPGHADILAEIGHCYAFLGNFDKAIPLLDKAIALSPIHPGWYHYAHAWRFALGDFWQAALLEIEKVPMPGFPWYYAHQAWFHAELGNMNAAEEAKKTLLKILPNFEGEVQHEMVFHYFTGPLVRKAFEGWQKAGLRVELAE